MKYKVGDKVRIISNTETEHEFEIGEIVLLTNVDSGGGPEICHKLDMSDWWYVGAGEIEPIESEPSPNYRALYEQEKAIIEQIKSAFSRYVKTEACGCCQDPIGHKEAEKRLAELLNPEPYEDGSGWKWY